MRVGPTGVPAATAAALPGRDRLRRFGVRVCVLYTLLTVTSSGWALSAGQDTDTHLHLLARLVFVCIGLGAVELVQAVRRRSPGSSGWLVGTVGYLVAVAAILTGLWVFAATGGDLHPDAYRDAFWNFTAVGVGVVAVLAIRDRVRARRGG